MIARPPVSTAMSSMIALRRSPNAGDFHRSNLQRAANLVHDQGRQRLSFHFLGDDQQRSAFTRNLLRARE